MFIVNNSNYSLSKLLDDVDNLENQPTTSTSLSMTDIRQKYLYNKSDSSFIRNKSIDEEILRKKEVVDMNLRSNKRKSINSRDYTLTMIDMDTLQEVKDKNDNEFIHQDLEVPPKKRSKNKKKEKGLYNMYMYINLLTFQLRKNRVY